MVIIDQFLSREDVQSWRRLLADAVWDDGRLTAGADAATVKHNEQLRDDSIVRVELANELLRRLGNHPVFTSAALPQRIHPPRFNRYRNDGTYGTHVDGAIMRLEGTSEVMRSDLSATLFLSNPEDYEGGELVIEGPYGAQEVKLAAGSMVVYPSGSLHQVAPVTDGERLAAITWIQSMVRDADQRTMLFDMDQAIQSLPDDAARLTLSGVYHNLIRRWAEV